MSGSQSQGLIPNAGGINIAQLIATLSPILLGSGTTKGKSGSSGTTTQNQSGTTNTATTGNTNTMSNTTGESSGTSVNTGVSSNTSSGTSSNTQTMSIDPATLMALNNISSGAIANSNNSSMTDGVVSDILNKAAVAFAPVIAQSNSAGLYNSSTLKLLSDQAKSQATAAASSAVLNYKTSQQQVALSGLNTIANNNKIIANTGTTDNTNKGLSTNTTDTTNKTNNTTNTNTTNNTNTNTTNNNNITGATNNITNTENVTGPSINSGGALNSLLGLGGSFLVNKALSASGVTKVAGSLGDKALDAIGSVLPDSVAQSLGLGSSGGGILVNDGIGANALAADASKISLGSEITPATSVIDMAPNTSIGGDVISTNLVDTSTAGIDTGVGGITDQGVAGGLNAGAETGVNTIGGAGGELGGVSVDATNFGGGTPIIDTGIDAGINAGVDTGINAGIDTGIDAGISGIDTGIGGISDLGGIIDSGISGIGNVLDGLNLSSLAGSLDSAINGNILNTVFNIPAGSQQIADLGLSGLLGSGSSIGTFAGEGIPLLADGGLDVAGLVSSGASFGELGLAGGIAEAGAEAGLTGLGAGLSLEGFEALGGSVAAGIGGAFDAVTEGALALLAAWIVCTELHKQGKMSSSVYRYGLKKFNSYPEYGKEGYWLWARPMVKYIKANPDSKTTAGIAYVFNRRAHNIAANGGSKTAKWTIQGAVFTGAISLTCCLLGKGIMTKRWLSKKLTSTRSLLYVR